MRRVLPDWSGGQWLAFAWLLAVSLIVGQTFAQQRGEDARFRRAIEAEQTRQAGEDERQLTALCGGFRQQAGSEVTERTTDIGRVLVRTAAASYELLGCGVRLGPIDTVRDGRGVDPDAYRTAPPIPPQR